ncbi:MAG TPA: DUF309 domain-containing protein [Thermoanaerobaculia bacterium]|nr:DUF309 domain-containing protein [Thermoanaerobaculia bacterium]
MIERDSRFLLGLQLMEQGDYAEAADEFEDLFFEAVRDEVEFVRVFLQLATGLHHVDRGTERAAIERLEEGIIAADKVQNWRGFDGPKIRNVIQEAENAIRDGRRPPSPQIRPVND